MTPGRLGRLPGLAGPLEVWGSETAPGGLPSLDRGHSIVARLEFEGAEALEVV